MENDHPVTKSADRTAAHPIVALRQMERNILAAFRAAEDESAALHDCAVVRHQTWVRMNALSDRIRALETRPRL
jgi:hypothetical protein